MLFLATTNICRVIQQHMMQWCDYAGVKNAEIIQKWKIPDIFEKYKDILLK